jgi:hypothetical protein
MPLAWSVDRKNMKKLKLGPCGIIRSSASPLFYHFLPGEELSLEDYSPMEGTLRQLGDEGLDDHKCYGNAAKRGIAHSRIK